MGSIHMVMTLEGIGEQIRSGELESAKKALTEAEREASDRTEVLFLRGYLTERTLQPEAALKLYDEALSINPNHTEAAFHAALLRDRFGDSEGAVELYERCANSKRVRVNALMNLAILYEEADRLREAENCLKNIVSEQPNHTRARQLMKSVQNTRTMAYDERFYRDRDQHDATLDVPISDFELSVRSRNCLRQMNIRTLGDLLKSSEPELLSYKNFGETSLTEIKAMLIQKGLKLGQMVPAPVEPPPVARSVNILGDSSTVLQKPISELELSVRSRKCLQRLGAATLGELVVHSEAELMATKNFGQTSLNEIRRQLAVFGLRLRQPTL